MEESSAHLMPTRGPIPSHQLDRALSFVFVSMGYFCPEPALMRSPDVRAALPRMRQLAKDGQGSAIFQGLADVFERLTSINEAVRTEEQAKGIKRPLY